MRASARRPLSPMVSSTDVAVTAAAASCPSGSRSTSSSFASESACRQRFNKEVRRSSSV